MSEQNDSQALNLSPMRHTAVGLAYQAGHILRNYHYSQTQLQQERKSTAMDVVTEADLAAEKLILGGIQSQFPDHDILSEESGSLEKQAENEFLWVVDPLDGTTNFVHGFPHFAVALALMHRGEVVLAVTFDPLRRELFLAERGQGATLNGQSIHVSQAESLEKALVATGFPYDRGGTPPTNIPQLSRILPHLHGVRRAGSAALDMAYVACGRLDGYWEFELQAWDWLGGKLLVEAAGGVVTQCDGGPSTLNSPSVLAGGATIHQALRDLLP